ncbi:GIY-YIG nuclease family protein [Pseudanabaena sp. FACHB-2040]|uniref:GIY-YIG nuclease family protein n=1 Tax=Pseudanabaena sp. FACHB-2040 TaxID=2692859 RepID=UPI0018EFD1E6|nr:hypothetical protein [Pseudanabaena sp. FACHB-2040]
MATLQFMNEADFQALLKPTRLWSRSEVLNGVCPLPREPGIYAWYFREIPPGVPTEGCIQANGTTLLYLGISPKKLPSNGSSANGRQLVSRVREHFKGNAEGSTLRLTLGCLLADTIQIELRRVGSSGKRRTFGDGEHRLSEWMETNAFITWFTVQEPWLLEQRLIAEVSLPLNLEHNQHHPFHSELSALRRHCRERADQLPVVA